MLQVANLVTFPIDISSTVGRDRARTREPTFPIVSNAASNESNSPDLGLNTDGRFGEIQI